MSTTTRNLIIFSVATLSGGFVGMALNQVMPSPDPMQSLGVLVWLATPLLTLILLRTFGGDGWGDFGLAPNFRSGWQWYLAALLIPAGATLLTLAIGFLAGALTWPGLGPESLNGLAGAAVVMFGSVLVKNFFEEFAWRGYLTPRFEALKLHPILNHVFTGLIWAGWHVPYFLYFLSRADLQSHTTLSLPVFIALAFLVMPGQAMVYGEMRLLSKSIWPVWLLHCMANAISLSLLNGSFIQLNGVLGAVFSPGTEGVVASALMWGLGLALYQYRSKSAPRPAGAGRPLAVAGD